tara:strand:- start:392 stop:589 length:198 start_codon:yes stop_codon:yes gene_type:complete
MFSIGKIFTLIIILLGVIFIFKILSNKRKSNEIKDPKNLDVSKCPNCGVWTSEKICTNNDCPFEN